MAEEVITTLSSVSWCMFKLSAAETFALLLQGSPFHTGPAAEFGRWGERGEQPQPDSGQCHQSVRAGAEEIPRLDCSKDFHCEENVDVEVIS